jgi:hypothetical protein
MRKILLLTLLTAVCGFTSLRADLTIVQRVDEKGMSRENSVMFKEGHARFDMSPAASMIWDIKSGELVKLVHAKKSYIKIPTDGMSPATPKDGGLALTPTGKKDTISGYAADEYAGTISGTKATVWLTKAGPDDAGLIKEMSAFYGMDLAALPGFPVRIVYESAPGETFSATLLSVTPKPIADSVFVIPADYKPMSAPVPTPPAPDTAKPASQ